MGYIYCITNLINSKRYIGKTTLTIQERFKEHCYASQHRKMDYPLYRAMRIYGIENFQISEIEKVDNDNLSEREIYWINELGTYGSQGYNATKGGDGVSLYDHKELVELARLGYTVPQICEKIGCGKDLLYRVLRANGIKVRNSRSKLVGQYDLAGNFIQIFFSAEEALEYLRSIGKCKSIKTSASRIRDCCKHKLDKAYGYKWEFMPEPKC